MKSRLEFSVVGLLIDQKIYMYVCTYIEFNGGEEKGVQVFDGRELIENI